MMIRRVAFVLGVVMGVVGASAGPLTPPPGAPASTNKTLREVEPRVAIHSLPPSGMSQHGILNSGSYYLTENLKVASTFGIGIFADDVVIDLNGFSITPAGGTSAFTINAPGGTVTIRNGTVRGLPGDLMSLSSPATTRVVFEDVTVVGGGPGLLLGAAGEARRCLVSATTGVAISGGDGSLVEGCVVAGGSTDAISVGNSSIVRHTRISNPGGVGIIGAEAVRVEACRIVGSGSTGILLGLSASVVGCNVSDAGSRGISLSSGSVLVDTTVSGSASDGVFIGSSSIASRVVSRENGAVGILTGFSTLIESCSVFLNGNHGIQVNGDCTVRFCNADNNGNASTSGAGIRNIGEGTFIDSCNVQDNDEGIFSVFGSLVTRCFASGNGTNYSLGGAGVVVNSASLATAGAWANVQF